MADDRPMFGENWPKYRPLSWVRSRPPWNESLPGAVGLTRPWAMVRLGVVPNFRSKSPSSRWKICAWAKGLATRRLTTKIQRLSMLHSMKSEEQ